MKIAIIGTRGVPARYGGFETAVEEIGAGLVGLGHEVVVYCRGGGDQREYRGMRRVVLPCIKRRALETISHTGLATVHALAHRPQAAIVMNAANGPFVAALRLAGVPTLLHIDGHDARRAKWRGLGSRYYGWATRLGMRVASRVVVDSQAVRRELGLAGDRRAVFIPYGALQSTASVQQIEDRLAGTGLVRRGYHLVVARFEPENNVLEIVRGYSSSAARLPLAVVGFEGYPGRYSEQVAAAVSRDRRIMLLGPVWDQGLLDALYAGAVSYLHGHSVGGTNPSLLRAIVHGAPVIAFDCPYNRETAGHSSLWFETPEQVAVAIQRVETTPGESADRAAAARARVLQKYVWRDVVASFDALLLEIVSRSQGDFRVRNL